MGEAAETNFDDSKERLRVVAEGLKTKGLHNRCSVFEGGDVEASI